MNCNKTWMGIALLGALLGASHATTARASLAECGGVFLSEGANCEYRKTEQCMTECKTETVEKACVAKLYVDCQSQCTATSETSCETMCSAGCTTSCTAQVAAPEPPNCMGLCVSDCQQTCEDGGQGRRGSCCGHNCNAKCEDKCKNAPPPPTKPEECTNTCTSACSGSCTAKSTVDCQMNCQTTIFNDCETELVETCMTKCEDDGGAIFCDGQFVNAANARSCGAELKEQFDFNIDFEGAGSVIVDTAKKTCDDACAVGQVGAGSGSGTGGGAGTTALLGLCATVFGAQRLRRRRSAR